MRLQYAAMAFTGFPLEAVAFYEGLQADNSRTYWQANKAVYERAVKAPMLALLDDLAEFGPFQVFRPYRDVRFAKDKTPYKENIGAYGESEGGAGYYVAFSATGMFMGSGLLRHAQRSARAIPRRHRRRDHRRPSSPSSSPRSRRRGFAPER